MSKPHNLIWNANAGLLKIIPAIPRRLKYTDPLWVSNILTYPKDRIWVHGYNSSQVALDSRYLQVLMNPAQSNITVPTRDGAMPICRFHMPPGIAVHQWANRPLCMQMEPFPSATSTCHQA